ncbi:glyoxalase superfamily protein [Serratia proteamaculans]|uniref:glyoxalase superfamily protein n=1 Tax=Serratia proteamaculans TaxID=28151 RepID=UPI0039B0905E
MEFSAAIPILRIFSVEKAKQYRYARPGVETVDWGKELIIADPFGNRLRFCQQIGNA